MMNHEEHTTPIIQSNFKFSKIRSILYDYSDAHITAKAIIAAANTGITAAPNNRNEKAILKNCVPFSSCISEIK